MSSSGASIGGDMVDVNGLPIDKVKEMKEQDFKLLLHEFWDFSLFHGNQMKIHTDPFDEPHKGHTSSTALVPTRVSRLAYQKALDVQPLYNTLYHKVAMDHGFLTKYLHSVSKHDEFMTRHLEIYDRVLKENAMPVTYLALNRSDYMCHLDRNVIKQVEFNTMSSAASGVNKAASLWHRYVTGTLFGLDNAHIPDNTATPTLATAMVRAWEVYSNPKACIVFIVNDREFNFADQRSLQYAIHKINKNIRIVRAVFHDLQYTVDESRKLFVNEIESAVVYYRYGYSPKHYIHEKMWTARYDIERSLAVKCPTIGYVLAGTKRVQQVLAAPNMLERFLDQESSAKVRETFIGLHSFAEDEGGDKSVCMAKEHPERFIMKPQRDGGGNNLHNADIVSKVESLTLEELAAYTLMEKIQPLTDENYIVGGGKVPERGEVVSELSIFGALVVSDGKVLMNEGAGYLFRTKQSHRAEGDLMRGTSSLDSPWLI